VSSSEWALAARGLNAQIALVYFVLCIPAALARLTCVHAAAGSNYHRDGSSLCNNVLVALGLRATLDELEEQRLAPHEHEMDISPFLPRWLGFLSPLPRSVIWIVLFNVLLAIVLNPRWFLPSTDFVPPCHGDARRRSVELINARIRNLTRVDEAARQTEEMYAMALQLDELVLHCNKALKQQSTAGLSRQCTKKECKQIRVRLPIVRFRFKLTTVCIELSYGCPDYDADASQRADSLALAPTIKDIHVPQLGDDEESLDDFALAAGRELLAKVRSQIDMASNCFIAYSSLSLIVGRPLKLFRPPLSAGMRATLFGHSQSAFVAVVVGAMWVSEVLSQPIFSLLSLEVYWKALLYDPCYLDAAFTTELSDRIRETCDRVYSYEANHSSTKDHADKT
jgi:hypothetical protein